MASKAKLTLTDDEAREAIRTLSIAARDLHSDRNNAERCQISRDLDEHRFALEKALDGS